ncbi:MAG: phosphoglycerate mutase family protein [Alphaproteobacteria bacterium]|nr:MAG: phosphoglycerate mutase family protein [Caulobacteraceae bacterium]TPW06430.1 MAG: phosphoglycerate mutase family protein [Alphaproteobacteria bacterium]
MPLLYLVRHGEPASGWGGPNPDPGLSRLGQAQAGLTAARLAALKVGAAITSPLMRCRETAGAFEMEAAVVARVSDGVREVPTPEGLADRPAWLAAAMRGAWSDDHGLARFRDGVVATLLALPHDAAVFSHFVAINAAVAVATGVDAVAVFKPGHASVTILENREGGLRLVELGAESPAIDAL